jgi:hypothetical protein
MKFYSASQEKAKHKKTTIKPKSTGFIIRGIIPLNNKNIILLKRKIQI